MWRRHLPENRGGKAAKFPRHRDFWIGKGGSGIQRLGRRRIRMRDTRCLLRSRQVFPHAGRILKACQYPHFYLVEGARGWLLLFMRRSTGNTEFSLAREWLRKLQRRQQEKLASRGATRWRCFPSADTTWPIIFSTGWTWASGFRIRQKFFM